VRPRTAPPKNGPRQLTLPSRPPSSDPVAIPMPRISVRFAPIRLEIAPVTSIATAVTTR
jgi:hypothetical protein